MQQHLLKGLTLPTLLFLMVQISLGQNLLFKRTIQATDTIADDDGLTLVVSSDDAEQENDEIDSLTDDDIDAGWEGEADDQNILTAGMRFQNVQVPQGARIDSAFFIVFSHEGKSTEDVARITIVGDATDNATTFTEDQLITDRPSTANTVLWEVAEEWEIYQPYQSADIAPIVQELVDRAGWQNGNAMAFILKGENQGPSEVENAREWEAFENIADPEDGGDGQNHPERVAQLLIYFSAPANNIDVPIVVTDTIVDDEGITLAVSSDDAEQENDEIDSLTDDDIDAGWEGEADDQNILTAGMRFQDLQIPQGATIDSSYVIVFSHEGKTVEDVARITIVAEATDNAETFTEDQLLTDRPQTTDSVLWEVAEEWEIYQPYRTVDISPVIQEVVTREGWAPGNAIALLFKGENQGPSEVENAREWEAFENIADPEDGGDGQNHPERVARLVVFWSGGDSITTSISQQLPVRYNQIQVYPNPVTSNEMILSLASEKAAEIRLINQNGQIVRSLFSPFGKEVKINSSPLASGFYFFHVIQEETVYTQKFIIDHR